MSKGSQASPIRSALRRAWLTRTAQAEARKAVLAKRNQPTPKPGRISSVTAKPNFNPYAEAMRGYRPDIADAIEALDQLYADARTRGQAVNSR